MPCPNRQPYSKNLTRWLQKWVYWNWTYIPFRLSGTYINAFLFLAEFQSQFDRHIDEKSPTGTPLSTITHHVVIHLSLIDDGGLQALGVLDVDGLDEGVELLLALLVVVTLTSDADTETVRDTLDAGFPDLLVELGVKADVLGTHSLLSKIPDGLDGAGSALLEGNTVQLFPNKKEV